MTGKCPFLGRREMLVGLGKAGGAAVVGGLAGGGLVARAVIPEAGAQTRETRPAVTIYRPQFPSAAYTSLVL
jgi:hypothetical protein